MPENNDNHPEIHMPSPSYWPLVMTVGVTFLVLGIILSFYLSGVGLIIFLIALIGWLREPTGA